MKKLFILFLILIYFVGYSQNDVEIFGSNDVYYQGGYNQLFKDMMEAAKANDLKPCSSAERYTPSILIELDSSIKLVKDFDSVIISKNKCAYDFSRKILPHLKKWIPLQVKGKTYAAIAKFNVQPFYICHSKQILRKIKQQTQNFLKG